MQLRDEVKPIDPQGKSVGGMMTILRQNEPPYREHFILWIFKRDVVVDVPVEQAKLVWIPRYPGSFKIVEHGREWGRLKFAPMGWKQAPHSGPGSDQRETGFALGELAFSAYTATVWSWALRGTREADRRRSEAFMATVINNLETAAPGGRNDALTRSARTLGLWVATGKLEQSVVEDALFAAATRIGLVANDGEQQTWATIRTGLVAGLPPPIDLHTNH